MAYLVIKHNGNPILAIHNSSLPELEAHIRNGYQNLLDEFLDGTITGEESETVPALASIPATERTIIWKLLQAKPFLEYLFDLENRVRVLEAKAPISKQVFIDAVKARLGL